jgi:diacylglycerol kinase (ATP)
LPRRALLVANPASGLGRTERLAAAIARRLAARGLATDVALTASSDAATRAVAGAVAAGCDRVIVAGGDGTINSVLGALAYAPAALGIIPTGMANAFARELGIPLALGAACDIAAGEVSRTLDLARAGSRLFALMAGIGFDADVVAHVNLRLKRVTGPGAYVLAGLARAVRFRPRQMRLVWDRGELITPALMVIAANAAHYTYWWRLAAAACPDDGLLDVVVFRCRTALDTPAYVVGALTGSHAYHPGLVTLRTRTLRVECDAALPVQLDGDLAGVTPIKMEIMPGALKALTPARRAATGS